MTIRCRDLFVTKLRRVLGRKMSWFPSMRLSQHLSMYRSMFKIAHKSHDDCDSRSTVRGMLLLDALKRQLATASTHPYQL